MRQLCLALAFLCGLAGPAAACGEATDCAVPAGVYRIALPEGDGTHPAMIWLHGWGGSAAGVMKNRGWIERLTARGYALIAPDGVRTSATRPNKNWAVNDGRVYDRDDIGFLQQVLDDATARHGIDRDRVLLSGFSRGGSMVWDVACHAPGFARAYAPVAGAFWEPLPAACDGPVDLFHVHGWTDRTVPLEGRPLRNGQMVQGDVFQSLFILREADGCANRQPASATIGEGAVLTRAWSDCAGARIDLTLHPGGHMIPRGWLIEALDWFEARLAEGRPETQ